MKRLLVALSALILIPGLSFLIFASPFQKGQGTRVLCPVDEVRTEITTRLPEPWFNTPQTGRLERTRVATIGGKRTMVCEYWAYGRTVGVMREIPEGVRGCRPERDGFTCF